MKNILDNDRARLSQTLEIMQISIFFQYFQDQLKTVFPFCNINLLYFIVHIAVLQKFIINPRRMRREGYGSHCVCLCVCVCVCVSPR